MSWWMAGVEMTDVESFDDCVLCSVCLRSVYAPNILLQRFIKAECYGKSANIPYPISYTILSVSRVRVIVISGEVVECHVFLRGNQIRFVFPRTPRRGSGLWVKKPRRGAMHLSTAHTCRRRRRRLSVMDSSAAALNLGTSKGCLHTRAR